LKKFYRKLMQMAAFNTIACPDNTPLQQMMTKIVTTHGGNGKESLPEAEIIRLALDVYLAWDDPTYTPTQAQKKERRSHPPRYSAGVFPRPFYNEDSLVQEINKEALSDGDDAWATHPLPH
jgi:hypothetical protein